MVLTVPAEPLQAFSQQFTVSVEPPGFIHHLIQLLVLVLSWTDRNVHLTSCFYLLCHKNNTGIKRHIAPAVTYSSYSLVRIPAAFLNHTTSVDSQLIHFLMKVSMCWQKVLWIWNSSKVHTTCCLAHTQLKCTREKMRWDWVSVLVWLCCWILEVHSGSCSVRTADVLKTHAHINYIQVNMKTLWSTGLDQSYYRQLCSR